MADLFYVAMWKLIFDNFIYPVVNASYEFGKESQLFIKEVENLQCNVVNSKFKLILYMTQGNITPSS